jgi:hypothetical protein
MTILKSNFVIGGRTISSAVMVASQSSLSIQTTHITSNLSKHGLQITSLLVPNAGQVATDGAASAREQAAIARTAANDASAHADASRAVLAAVTPLSKAANDAADAAATSAATAAGARDTVAELAAGIDARARAAASAAAAAVGAEASTRAAADAAAADAAAAELAAAAAAEHKGHAQAARDSASAQAERATQSAQDAAASAEGIHATQIASEAAQAAAEAAQAASEQAQATSEQAQAAAKAAQAGSEAAQADAIAQAQASAAAAGVADASADAAQLAQAEAGKQAQGSTAAAAASSAARDAAREAQAAAEAERRAAELARAGAEAARDESSEQAGAAGTSAAAADMSEAAAQAARDTALAAHDAALAAQRASEAARNASSEQAQAAATSAAAAAEHEAGSLVARQAARAAQLAAEAARAGSEASQGSNQAAQVASEAARDEAAAQAAAAAESAAAAKATESAVLAARNESTRQAQAAAASASAADESEAAALDAQAQAVAQAAAAGAAAAASSASAASADKVRAQAQAAQLAAEAAQRAASAARADAEAARDDANVEADAAAAAAANADASEAIALTARDAARMARDAANAAQVAAQAARDEAAAQAAASAASAAGVAGHEAAVRDYYNQTKTQAEAMAGYNAAALAAAAAADESEAAALAYRNTAQEQAASATASAAAADESEAAALAARDASRAAQAASEAARDESAALIASAAASAAAADDSEAAALASQLEATKQAGASAVSAAESAASALALAVARDAAQAAQVAAEAARDVAADMAAISDASADAADAAANAGAGSAAAAAADAVAADASAAAAAGSKDDAAKQATAAAGSAAAASTAATAAKASQDASAASATSSTASATEAKNARDVAVTHAGSAAAAADRAAALKAESQLLTGRDAMDGYPGLTGHKLNLKNAVGTLISYLTNSNTAARTYTLPDRDMTLAGADEIEALTTAVGAKLAASARDAVGGVAGVDTSFRLRLKSAAGTVVSFLTNAATAPRTYTMPDKSGTVALLEDIAGLNSGTNTGDETTATIKAKLGKATAAAAGYLDSIDFARFEAKQVALGYTPIDAAQIGLAGGVVPLGADAKIAAVFLPSYVDDVLEYASRAAFPEVGESGKLYVTADFSKTWRWSGSQYIEITGSPGSTDSVAEGAQNLYFTNERADERVRGALLTGLNLALNTAATAADTVLGAIGKLQRQASDTVAALALKASLSGANFTGGVSSTGAITAGMGTDGATQMEGGAHGSLVIGAAGRASGGTPRIDFRSSQGSGSANYDVRMVASGGNGATLGAGSLNIIAAALQRNGNVVLDAANVRTYAPALDGTGATGSWNINAATATSAAQATKLATPRAINGVNFDGTAAINVSELRGHNISDGLEKPNSAVFGSAKLRLQMLLASNVGATGSTWNDVLWMSSYTGDAGKGSNALVFGKESDFIGFSRQNYDATAWGPLRTIWHSGNMGAPSVTATPNSVMARDANGFVYGNYLHMTDEGVNGTNGAVTSIITKRGENAYRATTAASVKTFLAIRGNEVVTNSMDPASYVGFAKELGWKHYGGGHTIFDASAGTSPSGTAVDRANAQTPWTSTYPTLMGWNGGQTYGVRVDSARVADQANLLNGAAYTNGTGWFYSTGGSGWFNNTYSVGIWAREAGIVRTYNNARFVSTGTSPQAPAYAFDNDLDTGLYCPGDGNLNFAVDSQYVGNFNTAGNFSVRGGFYGSGAGLTGSAGALVAGNATNIDQAVWNGYSWRGINRFVVNKGGNSYGANNSDFTQFFSDDSGCSGFSFHRASSYATNITLDPDNCIAFGGWSAGTARKFTFNMGNADFVALGNIVAFSDERLKTNWRELGEDFVERWATVLHGIYDRIDTGERQVGLGAQSVRPILPDAVTRDKDGVLGLSYGNAAAVATVKLAQRYVALAEKNAALEKRCGELEKVMHDVLERIAALENN